MARPSSDVAIFNLALDQIKESSISIISTPVTNTEALCARWYDLIRQATLSAYNWNFALKSANILLVGTPEVSDYSDYYQLPNDYLKLRAIEDPKIPIGRKDFEIQGRYLLYSYGGEASLPIWYTKDETDVSLYPALFIRLLSAELAVVFGKKLTARPAVMKDIKEDLVEARRLARAADGQMRPPKRYESSRIVNAGLNLSANRTVAGDYEFPEGMDE
jgi:hypothetical protein